MNIADHLPLNPVPSDLWQARFNELMRNPWLRKKYNREERIREKWAYVHDYCPELIADETGGPGHVVDVGPGPGEFLEIARNFGHSVYGVDSPDGQGGMGCDYVELSRLMCWRQNIPVAYTGLIAYLDGLVDTQPEPPSASLFNFQGAWAQCWADHVDGEPHHIHHDVHKQHWRFTPELHCKWVQAFRAMAKHLCHGGRILIVANRLGDRPNQVEYDHAICHAAEKAGLSLVLHEDTWIHKWEKV